MLLAGNKASIVSKYKKKNKPESARMTTVAFRKIEIYWLGKPFTPGWVAFIETKGRLYMAYSPARNVGLARKFFEEIRCPD